MVSTPSVPFDALLLDLDGVLVLSEASISAAWSAWAQRVGLEWASVAPHVSGRLAVDTIRAVLPGSDEDSIRTHARWVNDYQVAHAREDEPVPGMRALVDEVARACPDHWAVVTACPRDLAEARLHAGKFEVPRTMICATDVKRGKPDPEGYLIAARRLGAASKALVVVEDSPAGIEAGKTAGAFVVALETTHSAEELGAADLVVRDGRCLQVNSEPAGGLVLRVHPRESRDG